jgi:hypothetical protein
VAEVGFMNTIIPYIIIGLSIIAFLIVIRLLWTSHHLTSLLKIGCILFIFFPANAQEDIDDPVIIDDPAIIPLPDKPMVFPEEMPKAANEISISLYGYVGDFNETAWDQEIAKLMNLTNMSF